MFTKSHITQFKGRKTKIWVIYQTKPNLQLKAQLTRLNLCYLGILCFKKLKGMEEEEHQDNNSLNNSNNEHAIGKYEY